MICQTCTEPTKHAIGFWDGANGSGGYIYDCDNINCLAKQESIERAMVIKSEMDKIDRINFLKGISMSMIKSKRKELRITIHKMADWLGISCSEYSDYEMCRKPLPLELHDRIDEIFHSEIKVKKPAENYINTLLKKYGRDR